MTNGFKKTRIAVLLFAAVMTFSFALASCRGGNKNNSNDFLDEISNFPEVKAMTNVVFLTDEPTDDQPYYTVRVSQNMETHIVTIYWFYVYTNPYRIMYYDVISDSEMTLEQWRKSKNSSLAGTKWVCKEGNFTQTITFPNDRDYEVDGEWAGTYSVDGNMVLMQRDEAHIDAFELMGDELIFTAPSGDTMVYKQQNIPDGAIVGMMEHNYS